MNEFVLSKRLQTVANEIPKGSKLADIGSDHAYLPCYAVHQGLITYAIAGEVNEGPYRSAKSQVDKLNLEEVIQVRKGDGLAVIESGEVDVITIAGMGGPLISGILEAGKGKLVGIKRLILQPNIGAKNIRIWLIENGWELKREHILEEDDKIYEILVAEKGNPLTAYREVENRESDLLLGPFLKQAKNTPFMKKWTHEVAKWKLILQQLEHVATENAETNEKKQSVTKKIKMVEEVLQR